ncbi:MAG TPA: 2-dehydropantoate 2-reductase N-terminal domain-containing protein, partial [Candidatus Thermoplasmatota archaeon]|nr:2-dehydropantoate 2-reductase N-terminal domain-containing protein [Candidatus Thermoplasmatota archaeon]
MRTTGARVTVVGAGALGSLLGALLQEAGHDVLLVGREAHVAAVAGEGLRVTGGAYGADR